jgi:hypothetical protein
MKPIDLFDRHPRLLLVPVFWPVALWVLIRGPWTP